MPNYTSYVVAYGDTIERMEAEVQTYMASGWTPSGSVFWFPQREEMCAEQHTEHHFCHFTTGIIFAQPMVK